MTLTICIAAKDGIVFASDSRATSYFTANDTVRKLFKLDDHMGIGIAGDGPLALYLLESISNQFDFGSGVTSVAEQFRSLSKERFDEFFSYQAPADRPHLQLILAGYKASGEAGIYTLDSRDNFVPRKSPVGFECIGVPIIATYILNRVYYPEASVEHAAEMAAFCIKETHTQDSSVGGAIQLISFSRSRTFAPFEEADITRISEKCERFNLLQKSNFADQENASSGTNRPADATQVE